jgi:hypothetical protein
MNDSFAESRAALRSLLETHAAASSGTPWTPRSAIMRAVVNPENRAAILAVATLATLAFPQVSRARALYPLMSKFAKVGRHFTKMRFRR